MESLCSAILPSSLFLFLKSVLPNCHIHIAIWLNLIICQLDFISLPNCEVHITILRSPCCHIFMAPFPHCQLYIKCYLALKPVDYLNAFQAAHQIGNYMMLLPWQSSHMCNFPKIDCTCDRRLILSRT
jgi:hypothetical protein